MDSKKRQISHFYMKRPIFIEAVEVEASSNTGPPDKNRLIENIPLTSGRLKAGEGWREDEMAGGITNLMDMFWSKLQELVMHRESWPSFYEMPRSPWNHNESDMTEQLNRN